VVCAHTTRSVAIRPCVRSPATPTASPCDTLILHLHCAAAASTLERLTAAAPQRVCVRTFTFGDVIWKCKTCQVGDDTCVVCQACFQGGDHEGHDVSFYISRQPDGGCCDCGDESAWAPSGFCTRHGRLSSTAELLRSVPSQLLQPAEALFGAVFAQLARAVLACVTPRPTEETRNGGETPASDALHPQRLRRLAYALDWVTATCVRFDGLCCLASAALRAPLLDAAAHVNGGGSLDDVVIDLDLSPFDGDEADGAGDTGDGGGGGSTAMDDDASPAAVAGEAASSSS
jgi:hypothetical protein